MTKVKISNPTPAGVSLEEGVPNFPACNQQTDAYMDISEQWTVKFNYSLTYTITADEHQPKLRPVTLN